MVDIVLTSFWPLATFRHRLERAASPPSPGLTPRCPKLAIGPPEAARNHATGCAGIDVPPTTVAAGITV